jgi:hypothetical protein
MPNLARYVKTLEELDTVQFFDDFLLDQSDINYIDTITDTGTAVAGDSVNGVVVLTPSDGTVADNDEVYIESPNEFLRFGANREQYLRFKFSTTINTVSAVNFAVGATDAPAADTLIDNGGGVKVSGSTVAVEKRDGETAFRFTTAVNGVGVTTLSNLAVASATDYVVEISVKDWDGTAMRATAKVNGDYLKDTNGNVITHRVPIASSTEMALFAGVKLGAATNNDVMNLDYWFASQTRV